MSKEFYVRMTFKDGASVMEGPFSEYIATHFLTDIPRRQFYREPEYMGIASVIKVDAEEYRRTFAEVKRKLLSGGR